MDKNLSQLNNLTSEELFLNQQKKKIPFWLCLIGLSILIILIVFLAPFFKKNRTVLISPQPAPLEVYQCSLNYSSTGSEAASPCVLENSKSKDELLTGPAPEQKETVLPDLFYNSSILILGVPGQGNDAPNLTDTILLTGIKNNSINLISIPRDLLVKISISPAGGFKQNIYTKINALYSLGNDTSLIQKKVEEISGLSIANYIIVDLQVIKELIDKIGGVNILVQKDIYDIHYPGPNHSFQTFEVKAGWRYFNGETALKYIRSRYSTSDFDRMERQQQVIEAAKSKLSSLKIWDIKEIAGIYQSLSSHIKTDLNPWEIWRIWETVNKISNNQISKYSIDEKFLISDNINLGGEQAYVLKPKTRLENYSEIKEFIQNL